MKKPRMEVEKKLRALLKFYLFNLGDSEFPKTETIIEFCNSIFVYKGLKLFGFFSSIIKSYIRKP